MVYFDHTFLDRHIFQYTGQLIISKIIKIVTTRCQMLRPKSTNFDIGWAPPDTQAGFQGASLKCGPHDFDPLKLKNSSRFPHAYMNIFIKNGVCTVRIVEPCTL